MTTRSGPLAQKIAAELRAELGRQNKSRRWLAEQIDQPHVTVSRWVNGDGGLTFDALDSICQALGISIADLLARVPSTSAVNSQPNRGFTTREAEYMFENNVVPALIAA